MLSFYTQKLTKTIDLEYKCNRTARFSLKGCSLLQGNITIVIFPHFIGYLEKVAE